MSVPVYEKSVAYLKTDLFKNLATLKFLTLYQDAPVLNLVEDAPGWALLVTIPTRILPYDTATYPEAKVAVFINGNSEPLKQRLLETLSPDNYVLRLNEELALSGLEKRFQIKAGNSYLSLSGSMAPDFAINGLIPGSTQITAEAIDLFRRNGYTETEIRKYFERGAVWFGLMINGNIRSGCFIYQNFGDIWEIAGVHTLESDRNKGYAKTVVASALTYLWRRNLFPRYDVHVDNHHSIKLAQSMGLKEFLRMNHFLLSSL